MSYVLVSINDLLIYINTFKVLSGKVLPVAVRNGRRRINAQVKSLQKKNKTENHNGIWK